MADGIAIVSTGLSPSFPEGDGSRPSERAGSDILLVIGPAPERVLPELDLTHCRAVLIELGHRSLREIINRNVAAKFHNIFGFARYGIGNKPGSVVELVAPPQSDMESLKAAKQVFAEVGLTVVVCHDAPGRILDRLIRPYLNQALNAVDRGLATADDLETTLKLGLGFPRGPLEILASDGLVNHFDIADRLYRALGEPSYLPAYDARAAAASRDADLRLESEDQDG